MPLSIRLGWVYAICLVVGCTAGPKAQPAEKAAASVPAFEDYPAEAIYIGSPPELDVSSSELAYSFRTVTRRFLAEGPNFAGYLTVVSIGCGTNCQFHLVVDARNGRVLPQYLQTSAGVENHIGSRLLVANPYSEGESPADREECDSCGSQAFYLWQEGKLLPLEPGQHSHLRESE